MPVKSILVDVYKIKDLFSGLGQFSFQFARHLAGKQSASRRFSLLIPPGAASLPSELNLVPATLFRRYFPSLNQGYDVWHSLHQFPAYFPALGTRHILTIHDLNFLYEKSGNKRKRYLHKLQRNVDRADTLTTISHFSRQMIEEHLDVKGREVKVIYNGVPELPQIAEKPPFMGKSRFFLSLGVFKKAKNFEVLLPVMEHFPDHQLVIAGNHQTNYGSEIRQGIQKAGLTKRVLLPGTVTDAEKKWLYQHCEAFLFPSLAEGFGLPVIEVMRFGKPVFLSKATCLPEIGGEVAWYFDEFGAPLMAETIIRGLADFRENQLDKASQIQAHASRFTWQSCIEGYLKVYG